MDAKLKIIGLSGTNGSGKDAVAELLAERYKYLFVSVSDLLRDECRKRDLPIERENLRMISAEWRREFGLGVLVDKAIELLQSEPGKYNGIVISPMRNVGEAQHLKDLGGTLVWVDADPQTRYDRIFSRRRSSEDNKTFEQFQADEAAEMHPQPGADDATLNMAAVKEMADIRIENNGSIEEFFQSIKDKLSL